MANCRFCGEEGFWRQVADKWMLFNPDGSEHRETCEWFVREEEEIEEINDSTIFICKSCKSKISIAGQRKLIERCKKDIELKTQQIWDFGDIQNPNDIFQSHCFSCGNFGFEIKK